MPILPMGMVVVPVFAILPALYAENTAVTLTQIGVILITVRLFDAVTDPLIGYLSDKTTSRFGKRKPWILAGMLLSTASIYFLYVPPDNASASYYLIWSALAYLGWTMVTIPHNAWTVDLSDDYNDRTRLFAYNHVLSIVGAMLFYAIPFLPIFATTDITLDVMRVAAWLIIPVLIITGAINILFCPKGAYVASDASTLLADLKAVIWNRPFWTYALALVLIGMGAAAAAGLSFIFIDSHLKIGEKFASINLLLLPLGILTIPLWLRLIERIGKHKAWAAGGFLYAGVSPLVIFLEPGQGAFIPYLLIAAVQACALAVSGLASPAMLTDVIDYDTWKSGAKRAASYFAIHSIIQKAIISIGSGLGLLLAGLADFRPGEDNTQQAVWTLLFIVGVLPSLFYIAAFYLIWRFPIDKRRQQILQKRIQQREFRARRNAETNAHNP